MCVVRLLVVLSVIACAGALAPSQSAAQESGSGTSAQGAGTEAASPEDGTAGPAQAPPGIGPGESIADAVAQEAARSFDWDQIIQPIRTDSPRRTIRSVLQLREELEAAYVAYQEDKTGDNLQRLETAIEQFLSLIDLSEVSPAARREVGINTMTHLLDILGRIRLPELEEIPGQEAFDAEGAAAWRIPDTPLRIVRMEEGPRRYEFLLSSRAVEAAPRFFDSIEALPLRTALPTRSWSDSWPQLTGPLVPAALVEVVPEGLKRLWLDTPVWKVLLVVALTAAAVVLIGVLHAALIPLRKGTGRVAIVTRLVTPLAVLAAIVTLNQFFRHQINISGDFSATVTLTSTTLFFLALAWVFWSGVNGVFGWMIASPKINSDGLNASLLRLTARLIGLVGAVIIIAAGAGSLGLPVYSLVAGLGVGGLAVALAVRPTLENLIGGIVLFADKPVRVGDFCTFGTYMGNVESIGLRSTQIRALDRTLIAIPNAKFADMEITNWARCDRMLIHQIVTVRYETTPDQLRYTLVKMREMFHAHPRIDPETIRVRLLKYGESGLEIEIRVYAMTREWNDFYAINEDVLLRVFSVVEEAGTGIAFPSRTLYMAQDQGLDQDRAKTSAERVRTWRRTGRLPFPRLSPQRMEQLHGTLDYPPRGSVETWTGAPPEAGAEPLSAEAPEPGYSREGLSADEAGAEPAKEREKEDQKGR